MRGLPPLPPDVVTLTCEWQCSQHYLTNSWHLYGPDYSTATPSDLASLISQWFDFCLPDLLSVVPVDAIAVTCRAAASGPTGAQLTEPLADNHGAFGATTPINAALVLTWRTVSGPNAARSRTLLPLVDAFVSPDLDRLTEISYAEAGSAARSYATHLNTLVLPPDRRATFVVVSRSDGGVPRPTATLTPVFTGDASRYIGTIQRRVRSRR